jgi:hypothetical protein
MCQNHILKSETFLDTNFNNGVSSFKMHQVRLIGVMNVQGDFTAEECCRLDLSEITAG